MREVGVGSFVVVLGVMARAGRVQAGDRDGGSVRQTLPILVAASS